MILSFFFFSLLISKIKSDYQSVSYSLSDSFSYAYFHGYSSASFSLRGTSGSVDFWIVDEDGFNSWQTDKNPSVAKSFTGTYCNNCDNYDITFYLPNSNTNYYFIISALFPSQSAQGTLSITYTGYGSYSSVTEQQSSGCFDGNSLIYLKNGSSITIKDATIGDEILTSTYSGKLVYSPIISIPHQRNNELRSKGVTLQLQNHENNFLTNLTLSNNHLLPVCYENNCLNCQTITSLLPFKLIYSQDIVINMCLLTTISSNTTNEKKTEWNKVQSILPIQSIKGLYSVVTISPYPVVNQVISSSFSFNHLLPSFYYKIHILLYEVGLMKYSFIQEGLNQMNEYMTDTLSSKSSYYDQFMTISRQYLTF